MRFLLFFLICFLPVPVFAGGTAYVIGDSVIEGIWDYVEVAPPVGYTLIEPEKLDDYGGKMLANFTAGRGLGAAGCTSTAFYGCLETETTDFDTIIIFGLIINDMFNWHNATYADTDAYVAAYRAFYQNLHADFPAVKKIVHITMYPIRIDSEGGTKCEDIFYGGSLTAAAPSCSTAAECIHEGNGSYRYVKNALMTANGDLPYVQYVDTWEALATEKTETALKAWQDIYVPDCIHLNQSYNTGWAAYYSHYLRNKIDVQYILGSQ